jgi:hypothetical protein
MRRGGISLIVFVLISFLLLVSTAAAEPIAWLTNQYTAYASSYIDGFYDYETQSGPPLPIKASSYVKAPYD